LFTDSPGEGSIVESDSHFYRRRASEELAAANRAITQAARGRRLQLAEGFLQHLESSQARALLDRWGIHDVTLAKEKASANHISRITEIA
jgi:hypothetical protein